MIQKLWTTVNEFMNKNINKQDLIDNPVDNGNTTDSKNRISNKFNDHFSTTGKKSLMKLQGI